MDFGLRTSFGFANKFWLAYNFVSSVFFDFELREDRLQLYAVHCAFDCGQDKGRVGDERVGLAVGRILGKRHEKDVASVEQCADVARVCAESVV